MKINAIIVEDNKSYANVLAEYLSDIEEIVLQSIAFDADEATQIILHFEPDVVFMDINLGKKTGFEVLENCKSSYKYVIFTTAYGEFAIKSYNYNTIHYLLKPYKKELIIEAVEKVKFCMIDTQKKNISSKLGLTTSTKDVLFIADKNKYIPIRIEEIIYLQADTSYSIIYTKETKFKISKPLRLLLEELDNNSDIIRLHKSYAVNLKYVSYIKRGINSLVALKNGIELPISLQEKDKVFKTLGIKQ